MYYSILLASCLALSIAPQDQARNHQAPAQDSTLTIIALKNVDAQRVEPIIHQLTSTSQPPAFRLAVDARTNSLLVRAAPRDLKAIKDLLTLLDREVPQAPRAPKVTSDTPKVGLFLLEHRRADYLVEIIINACQSWNREISSRRQGRGPQPGGHVMPQAVADRELNAIVIFSTEESIAQLGALIRELDRPLPKNSRFSDR